MAEHYLDNLLSRVVLWDVKNETQTLLTMCSGFDAQAEIDYLKQHGYNAEINSEAGPDPFGVVQIKITRC